MANGSTLAGLAAAAVLATGSVQAEKVSDFSDVINAGGARVEAIQKNTRESTNRLVTETQSILLAQATVETDGKVYVAEVIQVDGTKKSITYYRDPKGAIIAPPVKDGKLVDGNVAPENPVEARVAQKKILAKYDKNAQLMLAAVSKEDIFGKADKVLKEILTITEQGKTITKEQLIDGFYSAYIFNVALGGGKGEKTISGLESIAKIKMKISDSEITQIKRDAETRAKNVWRSVTGAVV